MEAVRANRFDLLRLVAALAVFFAHGDFLYRLHLPVPFPGHSLGSLAVYVFFFVSGYLVTLSWVRRPEWGAFWIKRVMRIFPGLVVAVVFSVLVVGWAATTLPSAAYWKSLATWVNLLNNAAGLATVQTLPGVFESNPFARTVNGSLWTIRYELAMYGVLALLAWRSQGRRWVYPATALALAGLWLVARLAQWDEGLQKAGGGLADLFLWRDFCGFGVPFFLGSSFAAYHVRPRGWMAGAALLAVPIALFVGQEAVRQVVVWLLIALGTFYAAHAGLAGLRGAGQGRMDLSYGVYIYAFPIQQALAQVGLSQGWPWGAYLAVSLVLVLVLAWLSWHWVERPAIQAAQALGAKLI